MGWSTDKKHSYVIDRYDVEIPDLYISVPLLWVCALSLRHSGNQVALWKSHNSATWLDWGPRNVEPLVLDIMLLCDCTIDKFWHCTQVPLAAPVEMIAGITNKELVQNSDMKSMTVFVLKCYCSDMQTSKKILFLRLVLSWRCIQLVPASLKAHTPLPILGARPPY